ncbi:hypothetical protein AAFF_G00374200 [Aldrovandia affinis]|uniref:Uncharacterized protein n=1 Tax=Aldrovandia affinis TaxID=143900 RepID=A0AAD7R519_9TELE|nr:hypothetical protein AAFF_G00374200 [Aldrovandia affinis]
MPPEHAGERRKRGSSPGESRPRRRRKPPGQVELMNRYEVLSNESEMDSETETETETQSPGTPINEFTSILSFDSNLLDQVGGMVSEISPTPPGLVGEGN